MVCQFLLHRDVEVTRPFSPKFLRPLVEQLTSEAHCYAQAGDFPLGTSGLAGVAFLFTGRVGKQFSRQADAIGRSLASQCP